MRAREEVNGRAEGPERVAEVGRWDQGRDSIPDGRRVAAAAHISAAAARAATHAAAAAAGLPLAAHISAAAGGGQGTFWAFYIRDPGTFFITPGGSHSPEGDSFVTAAQE